MGDGWTSTTEKTADISSFQSGKIQLDPVLSAEAETARSLLRSFENGTLPASQVFDVRLMGRFFAISDLWAACHGTNWHNLRFYYNPITTRLEPVVFDAIPFDECKHGLLLKTLFLMPATVFSTMMISSAPMLKNFTASPDPDILKILKQKYNSQAQS